MAHELTPMFMCESLKNDHHPYCERRPVQVRLVPQRRKTQNAAICATGYKVCVTTYNVLKCGTTKEQVVHEAQSVAFTGLSNGICMTLSRKDTFINCLLWGHVTNSDQWIVEKTHVSSGPRQSEPPHTPAG